MIPATIKSGKLEYNRYAFDAYAKKHGDGEYEMELTPKGEGKTRRQLRYIYGVIIPAISEHLGYSKDDIKQYIKRRFGVVFEYVDIDTGEVKTEPKSFADYRKGEMTALLDETILWASEIGVHVPHPEDLK